MPIIKYSGRQEVISANVDINFGDILVPGLFPAIDLPVNAIVVGGDLTVVTPWVNTTTATVAIGDVTNNPRYLSATNLMVAGRAPLLATGFLHTSVENLIQALLAITGPAATAGYARLRVDYIVKGRTRFATGLGR